MNSIIPDTIDNSQEDKKLANILRKIINENTKVYIATAYFNLEGFDLIKDSLIKAKEIKILIGRALSPKDVIDTEIFLEQLKSEVEERIDEEKEKKLVEEFLDFLKKDNVEIKIYRKNFFHGKFYIVENIPIIGAIAITGSSNFTYAGLTSNSEWNVVQKQESAVRETKDKFFQLWNESEDYKKELIELYSGWFSPYTPFEIYMKTLYEYFKDKYLEVSPNDELPSPIILADFQKDGYLAALETLEKYNGVLIADSVGLGKTYLALRILDDYAYKLRQKALIICPAQVRELLWERKLRDYGIRADVETQEKVSRDFDIERYADYDLIVIDESHNFRNSETKRWKNIFETIYQKKNKKVILLTATPVNNTVFDLYNQIRLIAKDKDDFFKSAGISSLIGYFIRADREKDVLYDLLEEIAVRRSRQFIKKFYPNAKIDGEVVRFPERKIETVKYNLSETYQGIYKECAELIENLILASYNIEAYRKEVYKDKEKDMETLKEVLTKMGWEKEKVTSFLMNYGRNVALITILKILFLKRLESSVRSFLISIERLLKFQKFFIQVLEKGRILDREIYRKFLLSQEIDEDQEEFIEPILDKLPIFNEEEYEVEEIKKAVKKDIETLEKLYEKIFQFKPEKDDKLLKLKEKLKELKGRKIIIYGYFKDTIRYLYKELREDEKFLQNIGLQEEKISIVDSDVSPEERKDRIYRFSPISNERPDYKNTEKEIQILLSTDVLSEGQNLQDVDTVINYDLPWNPVRLVQRVGRIDRLKCPHNIIYVYNFFPEDALESILKIVERLYEKLDSINRSVGLDVSVLGEAPSPKDFGYITRIYKEDKEIFDELEGLSELTIGEFLKEEVLDFIKEMGKDKLEKIPNGVGSACKKEGYRGVFVAFKDDERHYWCYYDLKTKKIIENKLEIMRIIKCSREAQLIPYEINPYEIIKEVKSYLISRLKTQQIRPPKLKAPQTYIVSWLQTQKSSVSDLIEYFSNPLPEIYLSKLKKIWNAKLDQSTLLDELRKFKENHPLVSEEKEEKVYEPRLKLISYLEII